MYQPMYSGNNSCFYFYNIEWRILFLSYGHCVTEPVNSKCFSRKTYHFTEKFNLHVLKFTGHTGHRGGHGFLMLILWIFICIFIQFHFISFILIYFNFMRNFCKIKYVFNINILLHFKKCFLYSLSLSLCVCNESTWILLKNLMNFERRFYKLKWNFSCSLSDSIHAHGNKNKTNKEKTRVKQTSGAIAINLSDPFCLMSCRIK